ncbi:MAG: 2-amino-4-hydroxy-6-hydroxymethyldihydropteridine diphosphokinase [Asticcacaulis sp.]
MLDLDLVAYGDRIIDEEGLVLPHPRAAERGFVMGPLAEIRPDWVHPTLEKTAQELLENIMIGLDAHPMK